MFCCGLRYDYVLVYIGLKLPETDSTFAGRFIEEKW